MTDPDEAAIRARRARWIAAAMAGVSSAACQPSPASSPAPPLPSAAATNDADASAAPPSNADAAAAAEARERDTDEDGVPDFRDECPYTVGVDDPERAGCPPTPCLTIAPPNVVVELARVVFKAHGAKVPVEAAPILDDLAKHLADQPTWRLRVLGRCRADEPAGIGARRAEAILDQLQLRGIARERLETITERCSPKEDAVPEATTASFEVLLPP